VIVLRSLPATTDCRRFCRFCLLFFLILYGAPAMQCLWRDIVTVISTLLLTYLLTYLHTPYSTVSFRMTLNDLEWLSEICNDTKRRAVSLRQLSFLLFYGFSADSNKVTDKLLFHWQILKERRRKVCIALAGMMRRAGATMSPTCL